MRVYTLRCEMLTDRTLTDTFTFFEDPRNLAKITPAWLSFQIVSPGRLKMRKDLRIEYRIKWLGLSMSWRTIIAEYDSPHLFVDVQRKGPFRLWRHRHTFEITKDGVKVTDCVDYALPLGAIGTLAHAIVVKRQLLSIFSYRQGQLAKLLGGQIVEIKKPSIVRLRDSNWAEPFKP